MKYVLMRPSPMMVLWIKAGCRMNRKWNAAWLSITVLRQARQGRGGDDE